MASQIRRIIWNTRERITSTDFNDATNLLNRGMLEMLASSSGRQTGVVHGLQASITGVGLAVSVSAGLAVFDNGTPTTADDSVFEWLELGSSTSVNVPAADPANPRWDVIEIAASDVVELSALRDVFNPALGTFTPQTLEKRRRSAPTISVRSGTPAATPVFPAGIAGVIPLAYILVPATVAVLTAGDEVLCRPLLGGGEQSGQFVGGGINVAAAGLAITATEASGRFPGRASEWRVPGAAAFTLATTTIDGATLPVADDDVHWYAAPAPYPVGYSSTLAGREFVPGSGTVASFGSVAAGQTGCIVFASASDPAALTAQGLPTLSSGSITDPLWSGVTIDAPSVTYLGTTRYVVGSNQLIPQRHNGGAEVIYNSTGFLANLPNETDTQNNSSQALTNYDASRADPFTIAGNTVMPPHAGDMRMRIFHTNNTGASFSIRLFEQPGGVVVYQRSIATALPSSIETVAWVNRTGQWEHVETATQQSQLIVTFDGYKDLILGSR